MIIGPTSSPFSSTSSPTSFIASPSPHHRVCRRRGQIHGGSGASADWAAWTRASTGTAVAVAAAMAANVVVPSGMSEAGTNPQRLCVCRMSNPASRRGAKAIGASIVAHPPG